jgi:hypothetical protein
MYDYHIFDDCPAIVKPVLGRDVGWRPLIWDPDRAPYHPRSIIQERKVVEPAFA